MTIPQIRQHGSERGKKKAVHIFKSLVASKTLRSANDGNFPLLEFFPKISNKIKSHDLALFCFKMTIIFVDSIEEKDFPDSFFT
jgi:hypothetical protein